MTLTFDECCRAILSSPKANEYVKAYASAGLNLYQHYKGADLLSAKQTQALLILNNITAWRDPEATFSVHSIRQALKAVAGVQR